MEKIKCKCGGELEPYIIKNGKPVKIDITEEYLKRVIKLFEIAEITRTSDIIEDIEAADFINHLKNYVQHLDHNEIITFNENSKKWEINGGSPSITIKKAKSENMGYDCMNRIIKQFKERKDE